MNSFDSAETSTKPPDPYLRLLKYILGVIVIGLLCFGVVFGLLYLSANLPYIQANSVVDQAKGLLSPLYDQLTAITSPVIQVKNKTGIQSGTYAFSLSDGAERSAHVWAEVNLASDASAESVIAPYRAFWKETGFSEILVTSQPMHVVSLFRSRDDQNLFAGVCLVNSPAGSKTSYYTAFIDYDTGPKCENNYPNSWQCIISRYCPA